MIFDIRLQRYRSYGDESYEFGEGVNIIVGPNASGKTNLLEALYVASLGRSFRAKDGELVAFGASWARIDAGDGNNPRTVKIIAQPNGLFAKEYVINNQKLKRLTVQRMMPAVLFEPNHLLLLHGSPEHRRDYLDDLLEQTEPSYGRTRRDYKRALAQRNALLKKGLTDQLFAWNVRLSETGAQLAAHRHKLSVIIDARINELYQAIAQSDEAEIRADYISSCGEDIEQYASQLLKTLEKRQTIDLERGYTTVGPHREDLRITYDGREVSEVASRGEARTILLALKVIELKLLEEARGQKPIFLLDDVFSELDGARRKALTENISGYQTFITTTDADVVIQHFLDKYEIIPLG